MKVGVGKELNHTLYTKNVSPPLLHGTVEAPVEIPPQQILVIPNSARGPENCFYSTQNESHGNGGVQSRGPKVCDLKREVPDSYKNKCDDKCDVMSTGNLHAQINKALSMGDGSNLCKCGNSTVHCEDKCKIQEEKTIEVKYSDIKFLNIPDSVEEESRGNVLNVIKANTLLQTAEVVLNEETWCNLNDVLVHFWLRNQFINASRKRTVAESTHKSIIYFHMRQAWDKILNLLDGKPDLIKMLEELVASQKVGVIIPS